MLDAGTPAATKVRAAESILNHVAKSIELEDIEVRVTELEKAAEQQGKRKYRIWTLEARNVPV